MAGARHDSVAREEERMRVKLPKKLIVCCDGELSATDTARSLLMCGRHVDR